MAFINPKRSGVYTLTPTGTSIAEDKSNVGQQMLKKMGWIPETGLGKDGNGIVEPVKASSNFSRKGLGKGPTQSSSGMVQQSAFNAILQSLSKHKSLTKCETKTKLEDKSKRSISRVHYGKFVKAKDVSQYSQEALKIVLGASVDSSESKAISLIPDSNGLKDTEIKQEFGVKTYSSSTDLTTYFAMKKTQKSKVKRKRHCSSSSGDNSILSKKIAPSEDVKFSLNYDCLKDEKEIPRSENSRVKAESPESDSEALMTEEKPSEMKKNPTPRSAAFMSSNVYSFPGYPFY